MLADRAPGVSPPAQGQLSVCRVHTQWTEWEGSVGSFMGAPTPLTAAQHCPRHNGAIRGGSGPCRARQKPAKASPPLQSQGSTTGAFENCRIASSQRASCEWLFVNRLLFCTLAGTARFLRLRWGLGSPIGAQGLSQCLTCDLSCTRGTMTVSHSRVSVCRLITLSPKDPWRSVLLFRLERGGLGEGRSADSPRPHTLGSWREVPAR